jgi:hypothetical protein
MLISFPYCVDESVKVIESAARAAGRGTVGSNRPGAGPPVRPRLLLTFGMFNLLSGDTWPSIVNPGADPLIGQAL